ncbi:hypothetical protein [Streptomyces dysideae]|uniref:Uncharacterized protein n=1 Tax=Streptomyces dysideae TaxID=909626 RepID=A0A101UTG9_9ACTN|nr:hypothetical protein AQJ91_34935 [Streptomyces dysideae]
MSQRPPPAGVVTPADGLGPVLQRLLDKRAEGRPEADEARELLEAVAYGTDTPTSGLRGPTSPTRAETERSMPSMPPGFGPPQAVGPMGPGMPGAEGLQLLVEEREQGRISSIV